MTRIVVFAKAPVPGRVKTRLAPVLGDDGAARLAAEMLAFTLAEARASGLPFELCGDPEPAQWPEPPDGPMTAQGEGGLGERLARAAERVLGGGEPLLFVGADCPGIDRYRLRAAADALAEHDAVIHPTEDGGYALLGLARFDRSIFDGIAWSTPSVAADTIARFRDLGWRLDVRETLRDIDEPDDLLWLANRERASPARMSGLPPYGELLGLRTERGAGGELLWVMPFRDEVIGRPGFLHGGAIAGLLEFAALGTLYDALGERGKVEAKPINVSVAFLRGGTDHDTYAAATISRLGKRVAAVEAHCWQQDRARPIASAQMNVLLKR